MSAFIEPLPAQINSDKTPVLEVSGLTVFYGAIQALDDVSFVVYPGEIVTLIGANGAGKSTTLRALSRIIKTRAGQMRYEGRDLGAMRADTVVRAGIAHVPEGRRVLARLSIHDNLTLGAFVRKSGTFGDDLDLMYTRFPRLADRRKQLAGTLSGGEQQMLAIARALMSRPKMLLLDEPSLGLAPIIVREIFAIIRQLNQDEGVTILLVEQNAGLALQTAVRGYVLEAGRVVMSGESSMLNDNEQVKRAYLG